MVGLGGVLGLRLLSRSLLLDPRITESRPPFPTTKSRHLRGRMDDAMLIR